MLELKNITKDYKIGNTVTHALKGVSLKFRDSEFVSILGPSGCGKTTLLNIVGGLDQYTEGDLIINGRSTKKYTDRDWDVYRNHSIGFVFQNYNLIPHQTVLANVELALTLSGVPKKVRRRRAIDALEQVGLGEHLYKKPNQMSGGQVQRVAIARALVNDPDILLADEPTGALDTQTSVQIMEILKEISRQRLIIMVTHNPELADRYSTRIIRILDGKITGDSAPFDGTPAEETTAAPSERENQSDERKTDDRRADPTARRRTSKRSMSFFTALSLSLNNLLTKKGRTFMTSLAGSIGIIGIALILSVSAGVNDYINTIQRDTLASYPIRLQAESVDMSALLLEMMNGSDEEVSHDRDKVYENTTMRKMMDTINNAETTKNDLKAFKKHLESTSVFDPYLSAVQYQYDFHWVMLTKASYDNGKVVKTDVAGLVSTMMGTSGMSGNSALSGSMYANYDVWEQALAGSDGEPIGDLIKEEYDLIDGRWPSAYNELLLVVTKQNEISDVTLYALGMKSMEDVTKSMFATGTEEENATQGSWEYSDFYDLEFRLLLASEVYRSSDGETYTDVTEEENNELMMNLLYNQGIPLKIVGVIRPNEDATATVLSKQIIYTSALTDLVLEKTEDAELLLRQKEDPSVDVLSGLPFRGEDVRELTAAEKKEAVLAYLASLSPAEKAAFCRKAMVNPTDEQVADAISEQLSTVTSEQLREMISTALQSQQGLDSETVEKYLNMMNDEAILNYASMMLATQYRAQYREQVEQMFSKMTDEQVVSYLDTALGMMNNDAFVTVYDAYLPKEYSDSTYEENLILLGNAEKDSPSGILLYAKTFENKDQIAGLIEEYNESVPEDQEISYVDYVALLMSSVTQIINSVTYVLIAFVAISLVVSSIMIGIITYISVLERTKEIGILRSIGASKRDISRVFNAETLIVGFVAGMIGIFVTLLLNLVITFIMQSLSDISALRATLPVAGAVILVLISMGLTLVAGLFPARFASKRNPVEALRSE